MRIDRNDLLNDSGVVVDVIKTQSKIPISIVRPEEGWIAVRWLRSGGNILRGLAIYDVDRFKFISVGKIGIFGGLGKKFFRFFS